MLISKVYVREGMFVKKGQPIVEISRHEEMEKLLANYKDAQMESTMAQDTLAIAKQLLERKAIPENQFSEAQIRHKKAKTIVERIASEIHITRQFISLVEQADEPPFLMVSPQDGTIIRLHLNEGEFIQPQTEGPVVMIADMNRLEVVAEVEPSDITNIKVGYPVAFSLSDKGNDLIGKVKSIAQEVRSGDTDPMLAMNQPTIRVVFQVRSPTRPGGLKLGSMGEVRIVTDTHKDALVIPVDAILSEGQDRYVYLVGGDRAKKRSIQVGMLTHQKAEVLAELALDERVVTRGQFLLYDQAPVVTFPSGEKPIR